VVEEEAKLVAAAVVDDEVVVVVVVAAAVLMFQRDRLASPSSTVETFVDCDSYRRQKCRQPEKKLIQINFDGDLHLLAREFTDIAKISKKIIPFRCDRIGDLNATNAMQIWDRILTCFVFRFEVK